METYIEISCMLTTGHCPKVNWATQASRMELYSTDEMANMHLVHGKANRNGRVPVTPYRQKCN